MSNITPWKDDVDVMELTDTDLEASRTKNTGVSDPSRELHLLVETLRRRWDFENRSATIDRAVRIELTHAIEEYEVPFEHADFDVAYTIPPLEWVRGRTYDTMSILDEEAVSEESRTIRFSTPPAAFEMIQAAIEEGYAENLTEFVRQSVRRQLGHS
jgi:hypothetical protein